jgi:hypothetical protein
MASHKDALLAELRAAFLDEPLQKFLQTPEATSGLDEASMAKLVAEYQHTFDEFLKRAVDANFGVHVANNGQHEMPVVQKEANVTLTEEDLLELDMSVQTLVHRRKHDPSRLAQYLAKSLQHKAELAKNILAECPTAFNGVDDTDSPSETLAKRKHQELLADPVEGGSQEDRDMNEEELLSEVHLLTERAKDYFAVLESLTATLK